MFFLAILGLTVRVAAAEPDTTLSTDSDVDAREEEVDDAREDRDDDDDERGGPEDREDDATFSDSAWQQTAPVGIDADPADLVGDPDDFGVDAAWLSAHSDGREEALRRGTSWLGRVDVGVTWRTTWAETSGRRDIVLLVGTWRL